MKMSSNLPTALEAETGSSSIRSWFPEELSNINTPDFQNSKTWNHLVTRSISKRQTRILSFIQRNVWILVPAAGNPTWSGEKFPFSFFHFLVAPKSDVAAFYPIRTGPNAVRFRGETSFWLWRIDQLIRIKVDHKTKKTSESEKCFHLNINKCLAFQLLHKIISGWKHFCLGFRKLTHFLYVWNKMKVFRN